MAERSPSLDAHSLKILVELQRDARKTVQQLSEAVGLSATPCWKRIKDMEDSGVITGYKIILRFQGNADAPPAGAHGRVDLTLER